MSDPTDLSWWFGSDPEKYDNNTQQAQDARTFGVGGVNHSLDVKGAQAQGSQLDAGNYNQDRGRQLGLAGALTQAANGQGPSAAAMAGQQARDASLSQAAALQAGRRGRSAAQGALIGSNAASQGVQNANAMEAQGRANEMATARGQLGGVLSGLAGQDIGVAGQNAQLSQNNNQFNAGMNQQANLANQQTQYGIGGQELGARQQENQMSYGNLNPGSQGLLPGLLGDAAQVGAGYFEGKGHGLKRGGVVFPRTLGDALHLPHFAGGAGDVEPTPFISPDVSRYAAPSRASIYETGPVSNGGGMGMALGIGQRVMPMFNVKEHQWQATGQALADAITNKLKDNAAKRQAEKEKTEKDADDAKQAKYGIPGISAPVTSPEQLPQDDDDDGGDSGPITSPTQAYARGGIIPGPIPALVGEAGPEIVLHLGDALHGGHVDAKPVSRPTLVALGVDGPDAVVNKKQRTEGRKLASGGVAMAKDDGTPSPVISGLADLAVRVRRLEKLRGGKR